MITVGETTNPDTNAPYTLQEAWEASKKLGTDKVEVILKTSNDTFENDFTTVSVSGRKTVLQLTSDVKTTKQLTTKNGATVTIDISGYTFDVSRRFTLTGNGANLIFRTSTASGKILCSNTGSNEAFFPGVKANQTSTLRFVSANNDDKLLTVEASHYMFTFGNATVGNTNIHFQGGQYTSSASHSIMILNSRTDSAPSTLKIAATDAKFTMASNFIVHNASNTAPNTGAFSMDSSIDLVGCTFEASSTVNFIGNRLQGRYFGTLSLTDCTMTNVSPNFNSLYTYVTATTDENGETVYDSNFPYYNGEGNTTSTSNISHDYRPEAVKAGYDGTNRVFLHGYNSFAGVNSGHIRSDRTGFNASNVKLDGHMFYASY